MCSLGGNFTNVSHLQVKVQVEAIIKVLSRTNINFVMCLQPHKLAGLCELFRKNPGRNLNQKLVRDQVRHYMWSCHPQLYDVMMT